MDNKIKKANTAKTSLLPIEGLPAPIQEFIQTCTDTYQTPRDYWAGAVLASTALAIGDKIQLQGKYTDVPIIWICNVGDVSIGKTEPLKRCLRFFEGKDDESIQKFNLSSAKFGITEDTPEDHLKFEPPGCFQYILKDATPEAMAVAHSVNKRGIMYYRDEIKGWIDDFNRYNKSGEQSNMLSSFSRVSMTYNRKGASKVINIQEPCILVAGGMQPDLLTSMAKNDRAESGFMARFAFVYPDNAKRPTYNKNTLPEGLMQDYNNYLNKLISLTEPISIYLGTEAEAEFEQWYNYNVDAINKAPNGYIKGVFGKLDIYCLRIVTIIRGMRLVHEKDVTEEVTLDEIKSAIMITEYFRATAIKVYENIYGMGNHQAIDKKYVAHFLVKVMNHPKKRVAELLFTSRSSLDRYLTE